jgi:hypothetical protein
MKNNNHHISTILLIEKMRKNPNKNMIQLLQQVLDGKALSYEEFISTGMFVPRDNPLIQQPNRLKPECRDIVLYIGGFFIQVLNRDNKTHYFYEYFDNQESDEMHTIVYHESLKDVERILWELQAKDYFNL